MSKMPEINLEELEEEKEELIEKPEKPEVTLETEKWTYLEGLINTALTEIPNLIIFPVLKVDARLKRGDVEKTGFAKSVIEYFKTYHPDVTVDPRFAILVSGMVYFGMVAATISTSKKKVIKQKPKVAPEEDQEKLKAIREKHEDIVEKIEKLEEAE